MINRFFVFMLLLVVAAPLFCQQHYTIDTVTYHLQGRTHEQTLRQHFGSLEGQTFNNEEELQAALDRYQQALMLNHTFYRVEVAKTITNDLVAIDVTIKDTFPFFPIPYAIYTTSGGFTAVLGAYLPNTGGLLFDTIFQFSINIPNRPEGLFWSDRTWDAQLELTNIRLATGKLSSKTSLSDQRRLIVDRGQEVFHYRSMELLTQLDYSYPLLPHWQLNSSLAGSYTFNNTIDDTFSSSINDYGVPYQFSFSPKIGFVFDGSTIEERVRQDLMVRFDTAYLLSRSVMTGITYNDIELYLKGGYFWRPTSFFYPKLTAEFYYKSGLPLFDLGRFTPGVIDNQWGGNGGLFINSSFLFKLFKWKGLGEMQMGPLIGYGVVFEQHRPFNAAIDQGFTAGIETVFLLDFLPAIPLSVTTAWDLRKRSDKAGFTKRFELGATATHRF